VVPANLAPPSSLSDQIALIKAAKDIPLKDKIIQMLNALLKQKKEGLFRSSLTKERVLYFFSSLCLIYSLLPSWT
jgi:hypothetical protein